MKKVFFVVMVFGIGIVLRFLPLETFYYFLIDQSPAVGNPVFVQAIIRIIIGIILVIPLCLLIGSCIRNNEDAFFFKVFGSTVGIIGIFIACLIFGSIRTREYSKLYYYKEISCVLCDKKQTLKTSKGMSWCENNNGKMYCYDCGVLIDLTTLEGCQESIDLFKKESIDG